MKVLETIQLLIQLKTNLLFNFFDEIASSPLRLDQQHLWICRLFIRSRLFRTFVRRNRSKIIVGHNVEKRENFKPESAHLLFKTFGQKFVACLATTYKNIFKNIYLPYLR